MKVSSIIKQHKAVAKRENTWAAQAEKDAVYNEKVAKKERKAGKPLLAKDSEREVKLCKMFGGKRRRIAKKELDEIPKNAK
jgi:hypothetical protein